MPPFRCLRAHAGGMGSSGSRLKPAPRGAPARFQRLGRGLCPPKATGPGGPIFAGAKICFWLPPALRRPAWAGAPSGLRQDADDEAVSFALPGSPMPLCGKSGDRRERQNPRLTFRDPASLAASLQRPEGLAFQRVFSQKAVRKPACSAAKTRGAARKTATAAIGNRRAEPSLESALRARDAPSRQGEKRYAQLPYSLFAREKLRAKRLAAPASRLAERAAHGEALRA